MDATETLLQAIAVTAELTGTELSKVAARVFAGDLARYPEHQVLPALTRCRRELRRGQFTIESVLSRLDDGRPGPEEAWAMLPRDEATTTVWTDEMRQAWALASELIADGETIQARMAFLEHYRTLVQKARDASLPVAWSASLGHDPFGREAALLDAAEKGRLPAEHVAGLLPHRDEPHPRILALMQKRQAAALPAEVADRV